MVLTTDVYTSLMYLSIACIVFFFLFNMLKQTVGVAFMGFASSYFSWIVAGMSVGTGVVANGSYVGNEMVNQLFTAIALVMFFLTLAVLGYPILTNKKNPDHQL